LDVSPVLGSRSMNARIALDGLTGRPLRRGDALPVGIARLSPPSRPNRPTWPRWWASHSTGISLDGQTILRFVPDAHWIMLPAGEQRALTEGHYRVTAQCDRMGLRLSGPRLSLADTPERLSAGVTFGTMQLPPDGQPIVLGPERQTTGGYPVLGTVASVDWARLGQLRPGDSVRVLPVTVETAQTLFHHRERHIARLAAGLGLRWPLHMRALAT
jgi:antagonist of KipI